MTRSATAVMSERSIRIGSRRSYLVNVWRFMFWGGGGEGVGVGVGGRSGSPGQHLNSALRFRTTRADHQHTPDRDRHTNPSKDTTDPKRKPNIKPHLMRRARRCLRIEYSGSSGSWTPGTRQLGARPSFWSSPRAWGVGLRNVCVDCVSDVYMDGLWSRETEPRFGDSCRQQKTPTESAQEARRQPTRPKTNKSPGAHLGQGAARAALARAVGARDHAQIARVVDGGVGEGEEDVALAAVLLLKWIGCGSDADRIRWMWVGCGLDVDRVGFTWEDGSGPGWALCRGAGRGRGGCAVLRVSEGSALGATLSQH
jgi:hypothetical protein